MTNIRTKGGDGEREVCKILNNLYLERMQTKQPEFTCEDIDLPFQRNQNQSAVGGSDITNDFLLCIEVKRHEALSVKSWWKQCLASAMRSKGSVPILMYRQNKKSWIVQMRLYDLSPECPKHLGGMTVSISMDHFLEWLKFYLRVYL